MIKKIPVILLVGGESSRFQNFINEKPSPKSLNKINKKSLIEYVFKNFIDYEYNNFILPLGNYKNEFIKFFESKKKIFNKKINVFFSKDDIKKVYNSNDNINIFLIDTGKNTNKAHRIKKCIDYFRLDDFLISYGDGVGDVNLKKLHRQHLKSQAYVTSAGYLPHSQYGHFYLKNNKVINIIEKPVLKQWVIIGYIFCNKHAIKYFNKYSKDDLEMGVMKKICNIGKLSLFKHNGFWKSVDTKKDLLELIRYLRKIKL